MRVGRTRWLLAAGLGILACAGRDDLSSYRLAVAAGKTPVGDIYVTDGNGRILERITDTPDQAEMWPLWSADGKKIFYETRTTADRALSLRVFELETKTDRLIYGPVSPGELWCSLSPDGTRLAYVLKDSVPGRLVVRDLRTEAITPVARPGEVLVRPEWDPESRRLLVQARGANDRTWDMVLIDLESGDRTVVGGAADTTEFKGRWSPDGRFVVYGVAGSPGRAAVGLTLLDLATGQRTTLTSPGDGRVVSAVW